MLTTPNTQQVLKSGCMGSCTESWGMIPGALTPTLLELNLINFLAILIYERQILMQRTRPVPYRFCCLGLEHSGISIQGISCLVQKILCWAAPKILLSRMEQTSTALVIMVTCSFQESISKAGMALRRATCNKRFIISNSKWIPSAEFQQPKCSQTKRSQRRYFISIKW